MDYVDLYLIHWPISAKPSEKLQSRIPKEDLVPLDYKGVWEAMKECRGLASLSLLVSATSLPRRLRLY